MFCTGRRTRDNQKECVVISVAQIDYWAASGSGLFHRASPVAKGFFFLLVVVAAVIARNPYPLAAVYAVLLMVAAATGLPWGKVVILSWYGAVFAFLYAISLQGGVWAAALFILKAITPAFAILMVIMSTPYPRIFSLLSALLPEILAAGLFMTYRTLFILLNMMENFAASIRLRGGFSPGSLYKNSANIAKGIGMVLVRSVERASRLYAVMVVRGYNGSMAEKGNIRLHPEDWLPLGTGILVLVIVIVWK
jgi:energy-coupling factor transporter transmembrane protein EcfT